MAGEAQRRGTLGISLHVRGTESQRPEEKSGKTSSTTGQSISMSVTVYGIYIYGKKVAKGLGRSLE